MRARLAGEAFTLVQLASEMTAFLPSVELPFRGVCHVAGDDVRPI